MALPERLQDPETNPNRKPERVSKLNAWLPPVVWAGVLFALSSIPGEHIPTLGFSFSDKVAHCFVYAVLGALTFRALRLTRGLRGSPAILIVALIVLGYGVSDEIHQLFVPRRSADVLDVLADLIGGTLGAVIASRISWLSGSSVR